MRLRLSTCTSTFGAADPAIVAALQRRWMPGKGWRTTSSACQQWGWPWEKRACRSLVLHILLVAPD